MLIDPGVRLVNLFCGNEGLLGCRSCLATHGVASIFAATIVVRKCAMFAWPPQLRVGNQAAAFSPWPPQL
jgi:hypothetical protein